VSGLAPGLFVALTVVVVTWVLARWYDPIPRSVIAVFGSVILVLFGQALFTSDVLIPTDNLRTNSPFAELPATDPPGNPLQNDLLIQMNPTMAQVRRAVGSGELPLWDPSVGAGLPLFCDPQAQVLQPLVLLALPFPVADCHEIIVALRLFFALTFTFLMLRRFGLDVTAALGGGLSFGLGGFLMLWLGWPHANSAAHLPLALYALLRSDQVGLRRDWLLLVLSNFCLLTGGHPETVAYAVLLEVVFVVFLSLKRGRGSRLSYGLRSSLSLVAAAGLAAPLLVPLSLYLPQTERAFLAEVAASRSSASEEAGAFTSPPRRQEWLSTATRKLVPVVAPNAFGNSRFSSYWGHGNSNEDSSGFAGTAAIFAAVLFALLGRRRPEENLFLLVTCVSLVLIANPPMLILLLEYVPILRGLTVHQFQRVLLFVNFGVACLAAFSIDHLMRCDEPGARRSTRRICIIVASGLIVFVAWAYWAHPNPVNPRDLMPLRTASMAAQVTILTVAAWAVVSGLGKRWLGRILVLLIGFELLFVHHSVNPPMPPPPTPREYPPSIRFLRDNLETDRIMVLKLALKPNLASSLGLSDIATYNPIQPYAVRLSQLPLMPARLGNLPHFVRVDHPILDALAVRFVLTRPNPHPQISLRRVLTDRSGWIFERPDPEELLYLPPGARRATEGSFYSWLLREPAAARAEFARALLAQGDGWREWTEETPSGFPKIAAVLEFPPGLHQWNSRDPDTSRISIDEVTPTHVRAIANLDEPRLMASSIYQDGGWSLTINGQPHPVVRANGPYVAAWLPAGRLSIEISYRAPGFLIGCILAGLSVLALLAVFLSKRRRPSAGQGTAAKDLESPQDPGLQYRRRSPSNGR